MFFARLNLLFVLFIAPIFLVNLCAQSESKLIVFAYGDSIHLWGDHENKAMAHFFADCINGLNNGSIRAHAQYLKSDSDFAALKSADAVIVFAEGEKFHPFFKRENLIRELSDNGVSFGFFHYALQPEDKSGYEALDYAIGGHYEPFYSVNPSFEAKFANFAPHPIANGVNPFSIYDEWYFNIKLESSKKIEAIARVTPPDNVRKGRDGPHSGNKIVRSNMGASETILWVCENPNKTRGFGFTGGHCIFNLLNDDYRKLLLNACLWLAAVEVPDTGVESPRPKYSELERKIEKPIRRDIESYKKRVEGQIEAWSIKD